MPRTEAREKLQGRVFDLLKGLRGEHQLRELCQELNYEYRNTALSSRRWRSAATQRLVDEKQVAGPVLLASAGSHDEFKIIYTRLLSSDLRLGYERQVVSQLLQDHPYTLFVFSNAGQDRWHFINVKYHGQSQRHSRIFRRIAVGGHDRLHTAAKRLAMLDLEAFKHRPDALPPLEIQKAHDNAFDVEAVTEAFFRGDTRTGEKGYKQIFDDLQQALYKQTRDRVWAHDYALQFLNRIMFLYFIQRKGWLGEEPEFLRALWQSYRANGKSKDLFVNRWLRVLFFEAFNRPIAARRSEFDFLQPNLRAAVQQAPFLNGGLFKPNVLDEPPGLKFTVSDAIFENCFTFFEGYNFTISEISPLDQEVAVDAEMLGKVYESLVNVSVEANEQGDMGTFYTPRTEIDLMCRLALVDNFANHLGQQHKHSLYAAIFALEEEEKIAADDAMSRAKLWQPFEVHLRQLAILDPACGSGSFLIGMLYLLHDLQARADQKLGNEEKPFDRKKRIIAENLCGVDVMKWITQETELGLWLNLVVGAPFTCAELQRWNKPLLPNFNCRIRRGDSLVQEVGGINLGHRRAGYEIPNEIKSQIRNLHRDKLKFYYSEASGQIHSEKEARQYEHSLFLSILQKREELLQKKLRIMQQKISGSRSQQLRLDGSMEPRSHQMDLQAIEWQRQLEALQDDRENIKRTYAALNQAVQGERPSVGDIFVWDVAFAEVFASEKNGFDIVIGNPPYVRQEKIADPHLATDKVTKENKQNYKSKLARSVYQAFPTYFGYNFARDSATRKLDAKSDLYIYFYFLSLSLLNPRGSFCFITSNSWLDVGYGAELQEFLLKHCHVKMIIDNQVMRVFAQADVNTIIALFSAPDESRAWGLEQTARFVMFKQPFENVVSADTFQQIESIHERQATSDFRIHPSQQRTLLAAGSDDAQGSQTCARSANSSKTVEPKSDLPPTGPLIKVECYLGDKWGGKYLRMPDSLRFILEKPNSQLVSLQQLFSYSYGLKSGIVDFFYLSEECIKEFEIERQFLRPILNSSRGISGYVAKPNAYVFWCHEPLQNVRTKGAGRYIEWGMKQKYHRITSVSGHRPFWYSLRADESICILLQFWDRRFWTPRMDKPTLVSNNFYGIKTANSTDVALAMLNSAFFFLQIETYGRTNQGLGVLTTYGPEFARIRLPFSANIPKELELKLVDAYRKLTLCEVVSIEDDLKRSERRALDVAMLEVVGISSSMIDEIYEDWLELVTNRLSKAGSKNSNDRGPYEFQ